jgi:hypothetical protein
MKKKAGSMTCLLQFLNVQTNMFGEGSPSFHIDGLHRFAFRNAPSSSPDRLNLGRRASAPGPKPSRRRKDKATIIVLKFCCALPIISTAGMEVRPTGAKGNRKSQMHKRLFHLLSAGILLVGLSGAVLIYQQADRDERAALGYEAADGSVYPIMPEDSKRYLHDLEQYGGMANVLADEFRRWFVGLWQGKSLAFTVACISMVLSLAVLYAANHLSSNAKSNRGEE